MKKNKLCILVELLADGPYDFELSPPKKRVEVIVPLIHQQKSILKTAGFWLSEITAMSDREREDWCAELLAKQAYRANHPAASRYDLSARKI